VCSGEYQCDRVHGVGAYYFTNGQVYEGRWDKGRKAGPLVYTVETQQCFAAEFDHLTLLWCAPAAVRVFGPEVALLALLAISSSTILPAPVSDWTWGIDTAGGKALPSNHPECDNSSNTIPYDVAGWACRHLTN
jgi:hypothetical protein